MHAMILAAGLGTRLRPLTDQIPKPLMPVVGVPNIVRIIERLKEAGIEEIVINTHWQPESLKARLGIGDALGVHITYSDEPTLLGTGGGIRKALPYLGRDGFVVINGDALFAPDFKRILQFHKTHGGPATMVLRPDPQAERYGAVGIDAANRIRRLVWAGEQTTDLQTYMFCGVHVLESDIATALPEQGCIVRNTYIPRIEEDRPVFGIVDDSYFCDLGTPERFLDANIQLVTGRAKLDGFRSPPNGIYIGRNVSLHPGCTLKPGTVVCDGVHIDAPITVEASVILEGARITRDTLHAVVSPDATIHTA